MCRIFSLTVRVSVLKFVKSLLAFGLIVVSLGTQAESPARALEMLEEAPVTKLDYGLHRLGPGLEKRLSVLESHPSGPRRISVQAYVTPKDQLLVSVSSLYLKDQIPDCDMAYQQIMRKLGFSAAMNSDARSLHWGDMLQSYFLDPIARELVNVSWLQITIYNGDYRKEQSRRCQSRIMEHRVRQLSSHKTGF